MTEIEDLRKRVVALEVALELRRDLEAVQQKLLFAAVRVAWEKDSAAVRKWLREARSSAAFGQAAFDQKPPELLGAMLSSLDAIVEALERTSGGH